MDKLKAKYNQLLQALSALDESIVLFKDLSIKKTTASCGYSYEQLYKAFRESMIQRFKFCSELFWKYTKKHLEHVVGYDEYNAPATVIRAAFSAWIFNEQEAENALIMIKDRNRTSHVYKEEIAEGLTKIIPGHYQLMNTMAQRLTPEQE